MKEKVSGNVFTAWAKPVPWHITWDQPWNINDILGVNGLKLEFFCRNIGLNRHAPIMGAMYICMSMGVMYIHMSAGS